MVEYEYRPELEVFRRKDNRGPSLKFNIVEARRIKSMVDLGIKPYSILRKIDFVNDVSETNIRTFIKNLEEGNIDLDGDYPMPTEDFGEMNLEIKTTGLEERYYELEDRVTTLEDLFEEVKKSRLDKVKEWIKL